MKKFVVYTAIVGAYDNIIQPLVVDDDFDYILFTDCIKENKVGVWEVRQIDYSNPDQTKIARYVKTHPHTLLPEYKCSVWMDASVVVKSDYLYQRTKMLYSSGVLLSSLKHPERDCIYDEAFAVVLYGFEKENVVVEWLKYLRKNKYPEHNGLFETRVLYRLQNVTVARFNEVWWNCINVYSRRDQLSFNYVLWSQHLECVNFLPVGVSVRESEHFSIRDHSKEQNRNAYKNANEPALLHFMKQHPQYEESIIQYYSKAFHSYNPNIIITISVIRVNVRHFVYRIKKYIKRKLGKCSTDNS